MKTVRLITCDDTFQAHLLQGALENEGIESVLHNDNLSSVMKGCLSDVSGVDILVFEDDYERAVQVLRDNQSFPEDLKCCPFCGSSDIRLQLRRGGRWKAIALIVLSVFVGNAAEGNGNWIYACKRCKATFEKPVIPES